MYIFLNVSSIDSITIDKWHGSPELFVEKKEFTVVNSVYAIEIPHPALIHLYVI